MHGRTDVKIYLYVDSNLSRNFLIIFVSAETSVDLMIETVAVNSFYESRVPHCFLGSESSYRRASFAYLYRDRSTSFKGREHSCVFVCVCVCERKRDRGENVEERFAVDGCLAVRKGAKGVERHRVSD